MTVRSILSSVLALMMTSGCTSVQSAGPLAYSTAEISVPKAFSLYETSADETYDEASAVQISLKGESAEIKGNGASVSGSDITITAAGTYVLSGTLNNGSVTIDTTDSDSVRLFLNGAEIHSANGPAIYVKNAKEVILTSLTGTTETISASGENADEKKGAVYAKDDLVITGGGSLNLTSEKGDAVHGNDKVTVSGALVNITAASDGIDANQNLLIQDSILTITSEKDGLKAGDSDDTTGEVTVKADVTISGGVINITAGDDGIQATGDVSGDDSDISIVAGGGYVNAPAHTDSFGKGNGGFFGNRRLQEENNMPVPGDSSGLNGQGTMETPGSLDNGMKEEDWDEWFGSFFYDDDFSDYYGMVPWSMEDYERFLDDLDDYSFIEPEEIPAPRDPKSSSLMEQTDESGKEKDGTLETSGSQTKENEETTGKTDKTEAATEKKSKESTKETESTQTEASEKTTEETATDTSESSKGISTDGSITLKGGTYVINASDDAVNADSNLTIAVNKLTVSAGDDALHADDTLTIESGDIVIAESYEGIEATHIAVKDGTVTVKASDDGINCANKLSETSYGMNQDDGSTITIDGGTVIVDAKGDGIDANGSITMNAGTVTVYGPENSGNGAIDYAGSFTVNGGTILAGGASGMAQAPNKASVGMIKVGISGTGTVEVRDADGKTILSYASEKSFSDLVIASDRLEKGKTYTIQQDGKEIGTCEISDTISLINTTQGSQFSGGMFQHGGSQRPEGFSSDPSETAPGNGMPGEGMGRRRRRDTAPSEDLNTGATPRTDGIPGTESIDENTEVNGGKL